MEIPIYQHIIEEIKKKITDGILKPGDAIPSENALCETYGVSRMTVRKGLAILVNEGYISSIPGKGSFVNEPDSKLYTLYYNEMANLINSIDSTKMIEVKIILPTPKLIDSLNIPRNKKVIMFKRIYYSNGEAVAYDEKYLIYYKGMPIVEKEIKYRTFPEIVSQYTSLFAIKKELTISAQLPSEEIAKHLSLYSVMPLLVVEQRLFNTQDKPIGMGITYYRGDTCKLFASSPFPSSID
ncbi:GntR family transcriptional regulator [Dehalobacter sp. DCM]|uniref:GntR family transcriptional regulator n=1 Tax=Dehalobacter sp. DCM TaxID=2907827 RepID=UPI0030817C51|nr:GntR family transcriptional regulator [Dehalobacter sp. DCM]